MHDVGDPAAVVKHARRTVENATVARHGCQPGERPTLRPDYSDKYRMIVVVAEDGTALDRSGRGGRV